MNYKNNINFKIIRLSGCCLAKQYSKVMQVTQAVWKLYVCLGWTIGKVMGGWGKSKTKTFSMHIIKKKIPSIIAKQKKSHLVKKTNKISTLGIPKVPTCQFTQLNLHN